MGWVANILCEIGVVIVIIGECGLHFGCLFVCAVMLLCLGFAGCFCVVIIVRLGFIMRCTLRWWLLVWVWFGF